MIVFITRRDDSTNFTMASYLSVRLSFWLCYTMISCISKRHGKTPH